MLRQEDQRESKPSHHLQCGVSELDFRCTPWKGINDSLDDLPQGNPRIGSLKIDAQNLSEEARLVKELETNTTLRRLTLSNFPKAESTTAFPQAMHDMPLHKQPLETPQLDQPHMNESNIATIA